MTTTIESPTFNKSVFRHGSTPIERSTPEAHAKLEKAEAEIEIARIRAEELRIAIAAKQERLEHLRTYRDQIATRLARLQNRDLGAQLAQSEEIFDRLFESSDLTSPNRRIELESATHALAWLPAAMKRQGKLIEQVKSELAKANAELTALESEK